MSINLVVQLGLKGFHSLQLILVRESRHGEGSLEALVQPLAIPSHLHLLQLELVLELSAYLDSDPVTCCEESFDILL